MVHKPRETESLYVERKYNKKLRGDNLEIFFVNRRLQSYSNSNSLTLLLLHRYRGNNLLSNFKITLYHNIMIALSTYILVHLLGYLQV